MVNIVRRGEPSSLPTPFGLTDPFQMMRDLWNWDPFAGMTPFRAAERATVYTPNFDVKETKDAYIFRADLPGVTEDDIDISLSGNRLTISGKREEEERQEGERYFCYERSYGSFTRSFTLPEDVDVDNVNADFSNGVLKVMVPKAPEAQPKKISLKGAAEKLKGALGGTKETGKGKDVSKQ
ncbi:MAG: Hsp20/alpha crystallin family protein [Myxococcota bacterium]